MAKRTKVLPRFRPNERVVLYGINSVTEALRARRRTLQRLHLRPTSSAGKSGRVEPLRELAAQAAVPIQPAEGNQLEMLCGSPHHQGAVLECSPLVPGDEAAALGRATAQNAVSVVLDQVEDPQNLGALVRSLTAFGVAAIVQPQHRAAPLSAAASRASAGVLESAPLFAVGNLVRFIKVCQQRGAWVAGTAPDGETLLHEFEPPRPLVLVLGNEGRGLRPLVRQHCDYVLSIRTPGVESLNVAAAAAVVLYQVTRP